MVIVEIAEPALRRVCQPNLYDVRYIPRHERAAAMHGAVPEPQVRAALLVAIASAGPTTPPACFLGVS